MDIDAEEVPVGVDKSLSNRDDLVVEEEDSDNSNRD